MATLSPPSLILLLQLLFLNTGDLLRLTTAGPVDDICRKTKEPPRCLTILKASNTRTAAAPLPELEQIAIEAATDSAVQNKIAFHNLFLSAKDSNSERIYENCENLYSNALDALLIAPEYLQQRRYAKLVAAAGTVRQAAGGCAAATGTNGGLKRRNDDVGLLADAVAFIANNLL